MKAKLQEYALLAEIISAIVVTLSLVFVGFQIQRNTRASEAATLQDISAVEVEILLSISTSPERAALITNFSNDPESLKGDLLPQALYAYSANIRHWEDLYLQYKAGFISEEAWETRSAVLVTSMRSPGGRYYLKEASSNMSGPFLKYIESVINNSDGELTK